jgi:hypothetical protein
MLNVVDEVTYGSGGSEVRLRKLRAASGERWL